MLLSLVALVLTGLQIKSFEEDCMVTGSVFTIELRYDCDLDKVPVIIIRLVPNAFLAGHRKMSP